MKIAQYLTNLYFRICRLPIIKWCPVELVGYDFCIRASGRNRLAKAEICRVAGASAYYAYYSTNGYWVHTETKTLAGAQLFIAQQFKKYS